MRVIRCVSLPELMCPEGWASDLQENRIACSHALPCLHVRLHPMTNYGLAAVHMGSNDMYYIALTGALGGSR